MSFPSVENYLRTDHNFRNPNEDNDAEVNHHKQYSILEELPIDMITSFVTSDPLHLFEIGIMKKYVKFNIKFYSNVSNSLICERFLTRLLYSYV